MTGQASLKPGSRTANHCAALLSSGEGRADLGPGFAEFGERLAGALGECVAEVADDPEVSIASRGAREVAGADLRGECAPLVAASRHRFGAAGHVLLVALDGRAILEQLDRTFGGMGDSGDALPTQLPKTAAVLAHRFERQVMEAIAGELGGLDFRADDGKPGDPFGALAPTAAMTMLTIDITTARGTEWQILLALETASLSSLLPKGVSAQRAPASRRKRGVDEAPFADLPLTAGARLVDMDIPLHRLATLQPGTVLPIMVARSVPLQIGDVVVARGTVGEVDDQVALQITQNFTGKENR